MPSVRVFHQASQRPFPSAVKASVQPKYQPLNSGVIWSNNLGPSKGAKSQTQRNKEGRKSYWQKYEGEFTANAFLPLSSRLCPFAPLRAYLLSVRVVFPHTSACCAQQIHNNPAVPTNPYLGHCISPVPPRVGLPPEDLRPPTGGLWGPTASRYPSHAAPVSVENRKKCCTRRKGGRTR